MKHLLIVLLCLFTTTSFAQVTSANTRGSKQKEELSKLKVAGKYPANSVLMTKDTLGIVQVIPIPVVEGTFAISGNISVGTGADTLNLFDIASVLEHWNYNTHDDMLGFVTDSACLKLEIVDPKLLQLNCMISSNVDSLTLDEFTLASSLYKGGATTTIKALSEISHTFNTKVAVANVQWITQQIPITANVSGTKNLVLTAQITNAGQAVTFSPFIECRYVLWQ